MKELKISAKDLGALLMPDFCPRCFWIKRNVKALPFQIFPGIFSSIDAYTKRVMHAWFDAHHRAPDWLPELQDSVGYLPNMHWSKFKRLDTETGITVSGVTDDIFECADGYHIIPDYKTAKFTDNQDKLIPIYKAQLNSYAWIHEGFGHKVKSITLIYCEPVTDAEACTPGIFKADGFDMGFHVKALALEIETGMVPELLKKAKQILDLAAPPQSVDGCPDCEKLNKLIQVVNL